MSCNGRAYADLVVAAPSRPLFAPSRTSAGVAFALLSAVSFGTSGALARPLLANGWSPGAVVTIRIALGALIVLPFGVRALRGRWHLLRRGAGVIALYGVLAVAGAQFCYFASLQYMQAGPALLIEYTAPAVVVLWMWLRHRLRPTRWTFVGIALAALGLVLVLDVTGAHFHPAGAAWALAAMVGAATYFIINSDDRLGLPPLALAAGGLVVGAITLAVLGALRLMPLAASTDAVTYAGLALPWWAPFLALGLVSTAVPYVTGIAAGRRLGSRLASFLGLSEVLAAILWSWVLLAELPRPVQFAGGALVLLGVVAVKLGERPATGEAPIPTATGPLPLP